MAEVAHLDESLAWSRFRGSQAPIAERACPSAIRRILELHDDPIRIAQVKLQSVTAHPRPGLHRSRRLASGDPVPGERLQNPVGIKSIDGHAEVVDAGLPVGPGRSQRQILRS